MNSLPGGFLFWHCNARWHIILLLCSQQSEYTQNISIKDMLTDNQSSYTTQIFLSPIYTILDMIIKFSSHCLFMRQLSTLEEINPAEKHQPLCDSKKFSKQWYSTPTMNFRDTYSMQIIMLIPVVGPYGRYSYIETRESPQGLCW